MKPLPKKAVFVRNMLKHYAKPFAKRRKFYAQPIFPRHSINLSSLHQCSHWGSCVPPADRRGTMKKFGVQFIYMYSLGNYKQRNVRNEKNDRWNYVKCNQLRGSPRFPSSIYIEISIITFWSTI